MFIFNLMLNVSDFVINYVIVIGGISTLDVFDG